MQYSQSKNILYSSLVAFFLATLVITFSFLSTYIFHDGTSKSFMNDLNCDADKIFFRSLSRSVACGTKQGVEIVDRLSEIIKGN